MRWLVLGMAALALAGCAHRGGPEGPSGAVERIDYETGACFGSCPVYRLSISPDGKGVFTGIRFTAVLGERGFTATPAQYAAFAHRLAPYRPANGDEPGTKCSQIATDLPSVDVRWSGRGQSQRLHFYYGCDMERNRGKAEVLGNAPDALPIGDLIGERP